MSPALKKIQIGDTKALLLRHYIPILVIYLVFNYWKLVIPFKKLQLLALLSSLKVKR